MTGIIRWARTVATCGLCVWLTLACGGIADAVTPISDTVPGYDGPRPAVPGPVSAMPGSAPVVAGPGMVPCRDRCPCIPNAQNFGFYKPIWRRWPGEVRPDITFPGSINKGVIPTPPGQEPIPVPRGSLVPPTEVPSLTPGSKDFGTGMGGTKIEGVLPGGGLGGLEEPSEKPKGGVPGLPGLSPNPKSGPPTLEPPTLEPPTAPKTNEEGSYRRPRGARPADRLQPQWSPPSPEGNIQNDWSRVLQPGSSADADRPRLTQAAAPPVRPQPNLEPVRPAAHQTAGVPGRSAVQRPVFEQSVGQPNRVAAASWQGESRPAMLDGYCPVELGKNERWSKGDPRCNETYQGMTFCFSNEMQRECFLSIPNVTCPPIRAVTRSC